MGYVVAQGLHLGVGVFVLVRELPVRVVGVDFGGHDFHPTFGDEM